MPFNTYVIPIVWCWIKINWGIDDIFTIQNHLLWMISLCLGIVIFLLTLKNVEKTFLYVGPLFHILHVQHVVNTLPGRQNPVEDLFLKFMIFTKRNDVSKPCQHDFQLRYRI